MKNEKGDAAFDSVDDVLEDRIIANSKERSKTKEQKHKSSYIDESDDSFIDEPTSRHKQRRMILIIGAAAALALLVVGFILFRSRSRSCCED